jgi:hypothetical protein
MLTRRTLAASALALPALAQSSTEITVHYAQPVIFKDSYDAIAAEFAKREPNIRINFVTTLNYEEGMQLILRQAATTLAVDLSYQGFNRLRLFAERGIAQDVMPLLRAEGDPAAAATPDKKDGEDGKPAHAKGFFALGDIATGVFAFGGLARGVVAFGGAAFGGVTFGGFSIGTFAAFGGGAVALLGSAVGGFAAGIVAAGGGAVGLVAQGGFAIGWLARGAAAKGVHAWSGRGAAPDAATQAVLDQYAWLVGPSGAAPQIHYNLLWTVVIAITVAVVALLALALPLLVARPTRDPIAEELNR